MSLPARARDAGDGRLDARSLHRGARRRGAALGATPARGRTAGRHRLGGSCQPSQRFQPLPRCRSPRSRRSCGGATSTFVSLQHDLRDGDAAILGDLPHVIDAGPNLHDFTDTAALISRLDAVIAVDTAVAHLAGALGKRLLLLLPYAADFRWLREREDSAWYPSARLPRQDKFADWSGAPARSRRAARPHRGGKQHVASSLD